MRIVNTHDTELVGRASAKFVTGGRVGVAVALCLPAGQPAASNFEGTDRIALVALEHLTVTGERLAIVGQHFIRRIAGHVVCGQQAEVEVIEGQPEIGCGVVVRVFIKGSPRIGGQADLRGVGVGVGMERKVNARVLCP